MRVNFKKSFQDWLRREGAEVLAPTNPYEVARFVANGCTHVVYEGRRGISANGFARECLDAFFNKTHVDMGFTQVPRSPMARQRVALLQRDGNKCFYCDLPMPPIDMTVEHLLSRDKGGADHQDNLVLAHGACNKAAANLPIKEKIHMYMSYRTK